MRERWHSRSAQGPVALMIQVALDALFFPGQLVSQQHAGYASMANIHGEHLGVIARHRARFHGLDQPLRHQALGKFALGIFVTEHRPAPPRVEQPLQLLLILAAGSRLKLAPAQAAIQPQAGAYGERAATAVLVQRQQEMYGMHQVRSLLQQAPAFEQRLADQSELAVLQVAQAAVDDAGGAAGGAGGEVMLLHQQGAPPGASALPGDGNTVDPAANHDDLESFTFERAPDWGSVVHIEIRQEAGCDTS